MITIIAAVAWFNSVNETIACVPIRYDSTGFTPQAVAQEMTADASTIELMRAVSRTAVFATDPVFADVLATPVYRFRFESLQVLKGYGRGTLELYGLSPDTRYRYNRDAVPRRRNPLWWTGDHGYEWLQETVLLDPTDSNTIACTDVLGFQVGVTYLVFRDERGALLAPGYRRTDHPARQRPVIEVIAGPSDLWLEEVRKTLAERGEGPATFWTWLIELVFGRRQASD